MSNHKGFSDLAFDTNQTANGHFSTFTLSIHEQSARKASWRDRFWQAGVDRLSRSDIDRRRAAVSTLSIDELHQSLTSKHEHNHFHTHTTSAYGVLVTFVQLLRHQVAALFVEGPHQSSANILRFYNDVLFCLTRYSSDWTQERAVSLLNDFFGKFDLPSPVFTTSRPQAPACPAAWLIYGNLLEASALFMETMQYAMYSPDREPNQVLRTHLRDHDTYFAVLEGLLDAIPLHGPSELAIKIALDTPVPLFGFTELVPGKPIDWQYFHPGYRLLSLVSQIAPHFAALKDLPRDARTIQFSYSRESLDGAFEIMRESASWREGRKTRSLASQPSVERLTAALTQRGHNLMQQLGLDRISPIMDHAFQAHVRAQTFSEANLFAAQLSGITMYNHEEALPPVETPPLVFALYSIFSGTVASEYFDKEPNRVVAALVLDIEAEALRQAAFGVDKVKAQRNLCAGFGVGGPDDPLRATVDLAISRFFS